MLAMLLGVLAMAGQDVLAPAQTLWARQPGAARFLDSSESYEGKPVRTIEHTGKEDWSLELGTAMPVRPGEILRLEAPVRIRGGGSCGVSFVLLAGGETLQWMAGSVALTQAEAWQTSRAAIIVPKGATAVQARLTGNGPAVFSLGAASLTRRFVPSAPSLSPVVLEDKLLRVEIAPETLATTILDRRTGKRWAQSGVATKVFPTNFRRQGVQAVWKGFAVDGVTPIEVRASLIAGKAEVRWEVYGDGQMPDLQIPGGVQATKESEHIVPVNMGMRIAANDSKIAPLWLHGYGGHGLSMAFYGLLDQGTGVATLLESSDDFRLTLDREAGLLQATPFWIGQKGRFGYPRVLTNAFFAKADLNTIALRYRTEAKRKGLWVPLTTKAKKNPNAARLARAANLWTWGGEPLSLAKQAYAAGFRNVLWSGGGSPETLKQVRKLGFIASRYDIYQDVMDPTRIKDLPWAHPDWTTAAWPDHLVRDASGDWVKGWVVQDKAGKDVPCAVCCDLEALPFAQKRIAGELKTHPFQARFIDTTTASEYRECYDPRHPMTRTQSKLARMKLLQMVTDFGLVAGSETGHEASVPNLVFFEGMMSLGPYRVPDAGTDPPKVYAELPKDVMTYQLGPKYRIPLWQLVFGDCTVSTWYWGDFSNKHLGTWTLRDQWNMLYGTPPMYFTDAAQFAAQRSRFAKSYEETQRVLRHAAMKQMVRFEDLNKDRTVQQTQWANGLTVTANFGATSFHGIPPGGVKVTEPRKP